MPIPSNDIALITGTTFALMSAATAAFATTNVDSAALILTFCASARPVKVLAAFVGTGVAVIAASLLIVVTASSLQFSPRYLGIFSLVIGIVQLVQNGKRDVEQHLFRATTSISIMAMCFLSCSTDNLALFAALIAKGGVGNVPFIAGFLCLLYGAGGGLCVIAGKRMLHTNARLRALGPAVTVCVGLSTLLYST